ncbi:MAG: plastocyanin/azurin family copper-binding protein [Acidimicrobiia bacterium]
MILVYTITQTKESDMWKRFTSLFALIIAVVLVAAACSSSGATSADDPVVEEDHATEETGQDAVSDDVDRVVEVDMAEFAFNADSFAFTPGETVKFVVTNSGVAEHEFRLSNQDRVDEHIAGGHDDHDEASDDDDESAHDDDEAAHEAGAEDVVLVLAAGETGTLVFTFPENDHDYTAIVCLIPGHYEAGMTTDIAFGA